MDLEQHCTVIYPLPKKKSSKTTDLHNLSHMATISSHDALNQLSLTNKFEKRTKSFSSVTPVVCASFPD